MQLRRHAIFLVGYMGAGKTSVGRYVAERLRWRFVDLDDRVEAATGRTVREIFAAEGEAVFRRYESEALVALLSEMTSGAPTVVALGGGAFAQETNAAALDEFAAPVVFLEAQAEELWQRTEQASQSRPLRTDETEFRQRYLERLPHYRKANYQVETSGKSSEEVAAEVAWLIMMSSST